MPAPDPWKTAVLGMVLFGGGVLVLVSSWKNAGWLLNSRKATRVKLILGEAGARILYATLGFSLAVCGLVLLLSGFMGER
ncbi:MAG: hypothetical protein LIP77_02060 [Planctomycetes bacterium]|nr:hypothetical protein [Planctomycetota bacterium]